ncbi:MAG: hypothetical protein ACKVVT_03125 [Dehalococcoidia bacterium]
MTAPMRELLVRVPEDVAAEAEREGLLAQDELAALLRRAAAGRALRRIWAELDKDPLPPMSETKSSL